jgi:hypothetical protein
MALNDRDAIEKAFQELKISSVDPLKHEFLNTTLGDVWSAVHMIEEEQSKRTALQNAQRIEPFLRTIESYSETIEVFCQGFPPMSFVWVRNCLSQT